MHRRLLLLSAALLLTGAAPSTGELPRTAMFGVSGTPQVAGDGSPGVRADTVAAGLTGEKLGLKGGDIVTDINGVKIADMAGFAGAASKIDAGKPVRMTIWRGGKRQVLTAASVGRPLESYRNGTAHYGAVPFRGGLLREVMVTPPGGAKGPVLFLIQGYTCDSFETTRDDSPHRLLFDGLLARGISVYRIEKAQAGDSRGGPSCRTGDFDAEMAGFETGYRTLMERHGIAPDRIFMLGHSMGGVEAPLLAAKVAAPRGVAVYGTVLRNWHDYMFDIFRVQGFTGGGADPIDGESGSEALRPLLRALLLDGKVPAELAANAEYAKMLRELLQWDGGDQIMARHYSFWQGLAKQRLVTAWRDTRSNVLSVYGEGDVAAIDNRDHQLIADMVNHWRPGTARFVEVPGTGHGMTIDGSMAEVRAARGSSADRPRPAFNPDLIPLFGDWIEATMRAPAVSTRFPAKQG